MNGKQTTSVSTTPPSKLMTQTVLPKTHDSKAYVRDTSIAPFVKHKRRNAYALRSVESVKANVYADWLRNQMR